jgi:hypothetical protein
MGLYLCVFAKDDVDDELDGVDVGSYDDFHDFRAAVCNRLEEGHWGSRYPVLMNHSDSDSDWSRDETAVLIQELESIHEHFQQMPPEDAAGWRGEAIRANGKPQSLDDCFVDVDGESLVARVASLAKLATSRSRPISFQ